MNTSYTFFFFAWILLFSNSSLAYRFIPYPYEESQEIIPAPKMMMVMPNEGDFTWPQHNALPVYQMPDQRIRRGWGSGRRRRSVSHNG